MTTISIGSSSDLVDFAARVNSGETTLDAMLTADIDLAGYPALRIGIDSSKFAGTFDGKGHSIKLCSTVDFGGLGYYYLFYGDPTSATIVNTKFTDIICHRSNSSNYADSDTSFYVIAGFKSASRLLFDTVYLSNYPNQFRASRWAGMGLCSATNVSDCMVINVTELSCQYPALLSGTRLSDCYLIGSATIHGGGSGSPGQWAQARPVYGDNGVTISNVFTKFTNIDGTAYDKSRIAGKPNGSWESGYPTIVNCYAADTFLINGSAVTSGTTTNQHGLSVSSTIYSQKGFWDGSGVDGTTYLSWDFENTWYWDSTDKTPKLRAFVVQISTAQELVDFATRVNAGEADLDAILTSDIDLAGETWIPIGNATYPYRGIFDGAGHVVSNLSLGTAESPVTYAGLFGYAGKCEIKNLGGENFTLYGNYCGICAFMNSGVASELSEIYNCYAKNFNGHGDYCGGIIGKGYCLIIHDCYSSDITAYDTYQGGGIAGGGNEQGVGKTVIYNCYSDNTVISSLNGIWAASGAIIGLTNSNSMAGYVCDISSCNVVGLNGTVIRGSRGQGNRLHGYANSVTFNKLYSANITCSNFTPSSDVNGGDGLTTTLETIQASEGIFFTTASNWYAGTVFDVPITPWDFTNTWYWDSAVNLPKLRVFPPLSKIKIFNGTSWVDGTPYVYSGDGWKQADKVWVHNGTEWKEQV